jgi:hypothetical protein
MTEMSRMPTSDMCSVRGMGVADMASTSTDFLIDLSRSFCATPKRCSSSMTTRPRSFQVTSLESRRWVPMIMSTSPVSTFRRISLSSFAE